MVYYACRYSMSDSSTPVVRSVQDDNNISPSLMNISQEAMLEIIGMKPVKRDTNKVEESTAASTSTPTLEEVEEKTVIVKADEEKTDTVKTGTQENQVKYNANDDNNEKDKAGSTLDIIAVSKLRCSTPEKDDANGKQCKELKSILQLAKEAKLDTNIGHKRKSMDINKTNEKLEQSENESSDEKGKHLLFYY